MNDYFLSYIVIIVYMISIMYYYYIYFMITIYKNKDNNKCDPISMIAGKIGGFENSATAFAGCIDGIQPQIRTDIEKTVDGLKDKIQEGATQLEETTTSMLGNLEAGYIAKNKEIEENLKLLTDSKRAMDQNMLQTYNSSRETLNNLNNII